MRAVKSAIRNPQSAIALTALLFLAVPVIAADREKALAVVETAIKAQGGNDALTKASIVQRSVKGTQFVFGKEHPFTSDVSMHLPERRRDSIVQTIGDQRNSVIIVVDGTRGWQSTGGTSSDMPRERVDEIQDELYVEWVATLVPLKDKKFELSLLPDGKFAGKATSVVKVTSTGKPDLQLSFDKDSGLLVKMERKEKFAGQEFTKEYWLMDYKDFSGVKLPSRIAEHRNGIKAVEWKIESCKFPEKIEGTVFTKP